MISSLSGILEHIDNDHLTLDVAGVGYEVFIPTSMIEELPKVGNKIKIYTYQYVREDEISLY